MSLVGNKFNWCSDEYLNKLEEHLRKHEDILNNFEFKQEIHTS